MPMLSICLDERSYAALQRCAADRGRSAEDLAEAAVSDALDAQVFTADLADPGRAVSTAQAAQAVLERLA